LASKGSKRKGGGGLFNGQSKWHMTLLKKVRQKHELTSLPAAPFGRKIGKGNKPKRNSGKKEKSRREGAQKEGFSREEKKVHTSQQG